MAKSKDQSSYIRVIDDTVSDEYKKQQLKESKWGFVFLFLFVLFPIVGIIGSITNSGPVILIALIAAIALTIYLSKRSKEKLEDRIAKAEKGDKTIPMSEEKLDDLKELLERLGDITMSSCNGFPMSRKEMAKVELLPVYGMAKNPPIEKCRFIRTDSEVKYFSKKDRQLILEAFQEENNNDIIWFSQKDIVKWTAASRIRVINYIDNNGEKMSFCFTRSSMFYNHLLLAVENDECVIHIQDKRPE